MRTMVLYDIRNNKVRLRVASACLDYGLQRIQLSAFAGSLSRPRQDALGERIAALISGAEGYAIVLPICERDLAAAREIGRHPV